MRLYALKGCTDQLRQLHKISIEILSMKIDHELFLVHVRAKDSTGRVDEDVGYAAIGNLKGDALGNAQLKSISKAKRRVTLSICGLGMLDETEVSTINGAQTYAPDAAHATTGMSHPLPVGEDGTPGATTPPHPTAENITTLVESARAANVDLEAFGHDMRRLMQLPESQKITKKFLRETMTLDQYNTARAHYGEALRVILEEDVPDHEPPSEGLTVDPSPAESSSAPAPDHADAAERDRQRLRQEVASWNLRISDKEREHVIQHNPYSKARSLLWKTRVDAPATLPIESAAD